nr:MAG TPA: hypothetical protein [Bacteriophage sp.]DAN36655.1 MAG TPA: hypothetical protein [Caudoviricetes sp.]DAN58264.1 MAG TPA: hypothetical protein [Bacteriophage sp.]DAS14913.1 MAG TPA: hypothetical protein [Caudoviricetes sp.]DAU13060.1 MAG TPA: hypothetical protein [Bacteriophage sp.]
MPLRLNTHKSNFIYAEWAENTTPERGIIPADFWRFTNHSAPYYG